MTQLIRHKGTIRKLSEQEIKEKGSVINNNLETLNAVKLLRTYKDKYIVLNGDLYEIHDSVIDSDDTSLVKNEDGSYNYDTLFYTNHATLESKLSYALFELEDYGE